MASYLEHSERWRHHGQPREASHWAAGDKAVLHLGPVKGCEECAEAPVEQKCWRSECRSGCYYPDVCSEVRP